MPIARFTESTLVPHADSIILVFPVYNHLIPYLVQRFVHRLPPLAEKAVYAVCIYGNSPGISMKYLQTLIKQKGGVLSCGFSVKMPYNYISPGQSIRSVFQPFPLREIPEDKQKQIFNAANSNLTRIAHAIQTKYISVLETEYERIEHLVD